MQCCQQSWCFLLIMIFFSLYLMALRTLPTFKTGMKNSLIIPRNFNVQHNTETQNIIIPEFKDIKNQRLDAPSIFTWGSDLHRMGLIDVKKSVFNLTRQIIRRGETFSIIINAHDQYGRQRVRGGDFLFATLTSTDSSTAGKVIDFNNGTYEVIFFAAWTGTTKINIILVHTFEALHFLKTVLWPMEKRVFWTGTFAHNHHSEFTLCEVKSVGTWDNKCEFPEPGALGGNTLLCEKPKTLPCSSLVSLTSKKSGFDVIDAIFNKLREKHADIFSQNVSYVQFTNGPKQLIIQESEVKWIREAENFTDMISIRPCGPDLPLPLSDGFWSGKKWNSFACDTKRWTAGQVEKCLRGKRVFFTGDSTTRQWGDELLRILGLKPTTHSRFLTKLHNPIINFQFRFHKYWLGSVKEGVYDGQFESDLLDSLTSSDCEYIVVISPWAHYCQWTRISFTDRLLYIKSAIKRFRARCPDAPVIIKTSHPRYHGFSGIIPLSSDGMLFEVRRMLQEIFSGMGLHFIDIWAMNLAYPVPNVVHMPREVIYEELQMFFTHVCNN
ncbi:NXPE family member 1-like [Anneissia japonica]|uniref:NXPE family member 1-like n=1 Tax=Anneissia japonica TaxID=1529436 RepID=UPI0014259B6F|nr:NXPE family member 1-like [Anneissia japonica]XP_033105486.1 NXPE family member 1-like [Anneissia japonica]